ncbi:MAG: HAD-IA family hydrolase [Cyanobacteriota bacterium]|nr:HAD-IA family hydrolase [Cyanobacteriota bacterium]
MALRALLWDVDGTLAETEFHGHRQAYNAAFRSAGLPWRWDVTTYRALLAVSGGRERLRHFFAQVGQEPLGDAQVESLMAAKQRAYADLARQGALPLRPGVQRLVAEAAARGWPQALVTTSSRSAVAALMASQGATLTSAFVFWVCGEDVASKKPSPEGYQQALSRLSLSPSQALALEDSPQGLEAATAAGVPCLLTLGESFFPLEGPGQWWRRATAAVDHLGEADLPAQVMQGPPCQPAMVTLSWLEGLLEAG